jgi:hypothetical protein
VTPQDLTMMSRQLPSTVRKAFGLRETQPDPGLIAYQRWPRAAQLRRMIHCVHAVHWRSNRLGLVFSVHLTGGRLRELPDQPRAFSQDWTGDIEWPAGFRARALELRTTPANLNAAIGMLKDLARWNPRNDRITFPR